jgi:hypothetical protein
MKLVTCALCFVSLAPAQTPKDVAGWGKIKWGIKVAEAGVAYGDQAKPEVRVNPVHLSDEAPIGRFSNWQWRWLRANPHEEGLGHRVYGHLGCLGCPQRGSAGSEGWNL